MKAIDFIQCEDCLDTIEEVYRKAVYSEEQREAIADFALYAEIKKLRTSKVGPAPHYFPNNIRKSPEVDIKC